jgi:CTP:molybdopterin cytidylyltransferase MocA
MRPPFPRVLGVDCNRAFDRGPAQLLRRSADRLVRVPMPNAAVDLDTPEDLLVVAPGAGEPTAP